MLIILGPEERNNTLPRLVFREFAGDLVEFGTIPQFDEGLFFLGVLFALSRTCS